MNNEIRNKIDDALFNFYIDADKDTIYDSLKEDIHNPEEYTKKKKKIISRIYNISYSRVSLYFF